MEETFTFNVVPPSPVFNVTASYTAIAKSPQNYYASSDIVWMLMASALVLMMVPAVCLFYAGAADRKQSLMLFRLPLITAALVGFQWYLWGYSLAFTPAVAPSSPPWSWFGGHSSGNALHDTLAKPTGADGPKLPELLYQFYEGMFASFTAALVCGGTIRDVPIGRFLLFITLWSILVYDTVARWSWHWAGWSNQYGVMDFAGGTAVHITSGTTVLAFYIFHAHDTRNMRDTSDLEVITGKLPDSENQELDQLDTAGKTQTQASTDARRDVEAQQSPEISIPLQDQPGMGFGASADDSPHNVNNMVLGTALLWIGWFGFNGGSALGGNLRAVSACVSTHVAACAGGTTSLLWFWMWSAMANFSKKKGKKKHRIPSVTHFCDGAIIGLVAITPAAGYVPVWSAGIFGVVSAILIFILKRVLRGIDQPLYIFSVHAGGGWVGMLLTGCFASQSVVGLDGYSYASILDRPRASVIGYQMLDAFMGFFYTFFATITILFGLKVVFSLPKRKWVSLFAKTNDKRKRRLEALPQHILREKYS